MKKRIVSILAVIMVISSLAMPQLAKAYSYGDPTEEKVAEAYAEMSAKLSESPPDYDQAEKIFATVEDEIKLHMGEDAVSAVKSELENENKDAILTNMQQVLVLNIARRLENVEGKFEEYETTRKLVGKADATYKKLSPIVEKNDPELDSTIKQEFETMLDSLGNPGLFGVGEKESDKEQFKKSKETVINGLKDQFDMKSVEIGHFGESATEDTTGTGNEWTDLGQLSNWIPLVLIVLVVAGVVFYSMKKRRS